jgi:hypothetical protein
MRYTSTDLQARPTLTLTVILTLFQKPFPVLPLACTDCRVSEATMRPGSV